MTKPLALIIEDDPSLNQVFSDTLQQIFEIVSCNDGDSALERLAQMTPRLVLLDLHLPGAKGSDILSYIRATDGLRDTIVILATADDRQADYLRDQANLVLLKPVSPIQLLQLASRLK